MRVEWQNSTLISGDVVAELTRIKQQPGKDISITGSPTLVRSLLRANLLDQLGFIMCPVVVGTGQRLFDDLTEQMSLKLVDSKAFSTGAVSLTYVPADA